jgi:hypothetical protein
MQLGIFTLGFTSTPVDEVTTPRLSIVLVVLNLVAILLRLRLSEPVLSLKTYSNFFICGLATYLLPHQPYVLTIDLVLQ